MLRKDKRFRVAVSLLLILLTGCAARDESTEQERGAQMDVQKMADIDSKYRSTEGDWLAFLGCWRDAVSKRLPDGGLPTEVNRTVAVGSAVYEQQRVWLDKLEKHIGLKLPKSYKEYAHITGGRWLVKSAGSPTYYSTPSNLSPINSVGKFMEVDQLNWGVWTKAASRARGGEVPPDVYYRYGYFEESTERQDLSLVRWKDLDYLIKVGELEQGTVLLINPFEITSDGEWEAWMLSPQLAGAARYRSFAEMMQHIAYQDVLESGGVFLPPAKLQGTCARYLKTAANTR